MLCDLRVLPKRITKLIVILVMLGYDGVKIFSKLWIDS